jgi:hypothetical protein
MQPNRAVDLAYTTAGKKLKSFTLDDDGTSSLPDTRSFVGSSPAAMRCSRRWPTG